MEIWASDIKKDWDVVRPILYNMLQDHDERPEDIYSACVTGKAVYFWTADGFIVVQEIQNTITHDKALYVVCAGKWPDAVSTVQESLITKYEPKLIEMAQSIGAKSIEFSTKRTGYDRLLSDDWKKEKIIYSRRV